jgi:hypothetical protein
MNPPPVVPLQDLLQQLQQFQNVFAMAPSNAQQAPSGNNLYANNAPPSNAGPPKIDPRLAYLNNNTNPPR